MILFFISMKNLNLSLNNNNWGGVLGWNVIYIINYAIMSCSCWWKFIPSNRSSSSLLSGTFPPSGPRRRPCSDLPFPFARKTTSGDTCAPAAPEVTTRGGSTSLCKSLTFLSRSPLLLCPTLGWSRVEKKKKKKKEEEEEKRNFENTTTLK